MCGPSWVPARLVKPAPTRLQVSPFSSTNAPVEPAVVGSAASVSWLTRLSPASKVAFEGQPWPSLQVVASSGVDMRIWMPLASATPFPVVTLIRPRVSAPCPVPNELHAFPVGSSPVPYWQSGPGSLVSPSSVSSLSPVWGFEVLITPKPQSNWFVFVQKLRTPGPIRIAVSTKPGLWQHVSPNGQFTLWPEVSSQPPWMHTVWTQAAEVSSVTVKVVMAVGVGCVTPPASTQGVCAHVPVAPPQLASLVQMAKRFMLALVVQTFTAAGSGGPRLVVW